MIDARGLSCPMPVVMVQNEVKKNSPKKLQVQVDSMVCVENITRFANSKQYAVSVEKKDSEFILTLQKK
jgi:TusA-related sulfurtransferase